jgi:hypothetical protein
MDGTVRERPKRPGKNPKANASGATGTLSLTVTPACDVFVDGRKIGTSPLTAVIRQNLQP